jgi:hypothetical protein
MVITGEGYTKTGEKKKEEKGKTRDHFRGN